MLYSVIIPVYNEKDTIHEILRRIEAVDIPKEIILVDDGSTDGTKEILQNHYLGKKNYTVIFHPANRGKGAAIKTSLQYVTGGRVIVQDADLEYNPQDYYNLIKPFETDPSLKVVFGSRYLESSNKHSYYLFLLGGKVFTWILNSMFGQKLTDIATCYKVIDTEVLKSLNLQCEKFEFCAEVTVKLCKKNYKIVEVPISYAPRTFEEGKKIKWTDGIEYTWTIIKYRFIN